MANEKILVVEDELIIAEEIKLQLSSLGYKVTGTVGTAEKAIRLIESDPPDLVLMDIKLKGNMDGIEAAGIINERYGIPIIFLTAHSDEATLQRAKLSCPMGYIIKPFNKSHAYSTIEVVLYRHLREKKLRESERWLSNTIKSIGNAMIGTDTAGIVSFMNPAASLITGVSAKLACGKRLDEIFVLIDLHTGEIRSDILAFGAVENPRKMARGSAVMKSGDGYMIPVEYVVSPVQKDGEQETGIIFMFNDISERLKIEEALRGNESKYRCMVEMAGEGVMSLNADHTISFANQNLADMLGLSKSAIVGQPIDPFLGNEYKTLLLNSIKNSPDNNVIRCDVRLACNNGTFRWAIFNISRLFDRNGGYAGSLIMVSDITERKMAEYDLKEALARAELYLDLMTHDIDNMGHAVMGYLELGEEMLAASGRIEQADSYVIKRPKEVLKACTRLIDCVRDLCLEQEGRLPRDVYDLGALLNSVKTRAVKEHGNGVVINHSSLDDHRVLASCMLADLFSCIIDSAIGHSWENPVIDVIQEEILRDGKKYYTVCIGDNGTRMPPEVREKISCRRDSQWYKANSRGVGLYMSRVLLRSYNGEIRLEDVAHDDGSQGIRFVVELPACE